MDTLFHFVFPLIAASAARVHVRHGIPTLLLMAFLAALIDIDHFIGITRGTLHNLFVVLLLPAVLLILAFRYGKEYHRQISIMLLLFLFSHVILDMFQEGSVALLYPLTTAKFSIMFSVAAPTAAGGLLISSASIGLLIYFGMIAFCFFLEEIDSFMLRKHEGFRKAFKDAARKEKKELRKGL